MPTRTPRPRRRTTRQLLPVALVLALVSGCSVDLPFDSDGSASARAREIVDEISQAVEEAKEGNAERSGAVERRTAPGRAIRTDTNTAFDYQEYNRTLEATIASLEEFWRQALPTTFNVAYRQTPRFTYYRPEEGGGPRCGSEAPPPKNAFYCPAGDFIAWDETGLMIPYYVSAGDFAAAFVIAHEFGHAMQARLPRTQQLGVLTELQADCFAGAWARFVQEQQLLEAGDLDEATLALFTARDVPGTEFTDPRAHGSGFERTRAFADGYESGPARCFPARQEWLVQS